MNTTEVVRLLGVKRSLVQHWVYNEVAKFSFPKDIGTGNDRNWTTDDVLRALVLKEMHAAGVFTGTSRKFIQEVDSAALKRDILSIKVTDHSYLVVHMKALRKALDGKA